MHACKAHEYNTACVPMVCNTVLYFSRVVEAYCHSMWLLTSHCRFYSFPSPFPIADLPPPLVPVGASGSQGNSPILPRHQQPSPNQSYNPFSWERQSSLTMLLFSSEIYFKLFFESMLILLCSVIHCAPPHYSSDYYTRQINRINFVFAWFSF